LGREFTPEGFPGGGRCGGGEAAGALPPRQDAGRVPFQSIDMIEADTIRAETLNKRRPARKFPHELCYAEAE
jgi:hypothetical protein